MLKLGLIDTGSTPADDWQAAADRLADAWETEEGIEGINSFINKGVPSWRVK